MRVIVLGATGNVGTGVMAALAGSGGVSDLVGVARRTPPSSPAGATFVAADLVTADLAALFRGADAVVHLAWLIQPGRDESITASVNVLGSERVLAAVAEAGVPTLVAASSVGAYSPGPEDRRVDETWPTDGIPSSLYSRQKVSLERNLDRLCADHPDLRVVRMRPGLIFQRGAATEIRRLFLGPWFPRGLLANGLVPVVPSLPRLRFQAVHSDDVGAAYARAVLDPGAAGAYNLAADPVIGPAELGTALGARPVPVPTPLLRGAAGLAYRCRFSPTEPGWLDLALGVPLMSSDRAERELDWRPRRDALATLRELLGGIGDGADLPTPPLAATTSGPARGREFGTGVGARP